MTEPKQPEALRSLYDITGNIADVNTLLINYGDLRDLRAKNKVLSADNDALRAGYDAARLAIESLRARSLPEIKDMHNGPQQLNLSDRAMWVLGWNECRDAARDADRSMRAAQPAGAQQPGAAYAALPDECDSPEICAISKTCAGQFGTKRICASHGQAPAQPDNSAVHLSHCNMGEHVGSCKYGDDDCPALRKAPAQAAPAAVAGPVAPFTGMNTPWPKVEKDRLSNVCAEIFGRPAAAPTAHPAPQQETQSALFDKQGFRAWVLHNLPDDTIIGSSAYWADHLSAWAQRFVKKAPQQEATDALARAEYYIDNPSAWSSLDQRISDDISAVTEALRAALAAPKPQQAAQEPVAWYVTGCGRLLDEYEAEAEARRIGGTAKAMPLYTVPKPSPASQGDALDAARYRWLRNKSTVLHNTAWLGGATAVQRDVDFLRRDDALAALDAAIDAARAAQKGGE